MESNIILYTTDTGNVSVQVQYEDGTFWLTQKRMSELFGVEVHTVNYHLKEIFQSGELQEDAVVRKIRITAADGKNYLTNFYHLDAIIAVGYRVNSKQATQFRIWATKTLNEFIVKGYVLDKERLIKGSSFGHDYFKELLVEIREIRASERRFYQKITDLYALAIDYDKDSPMTRMFFATVQNKLHWAITGKTAAEIIYESADASKPHMGLTTWKNSPDGKVLKSDVTIAKNYLNENNINALNRLVTAYIDLAEDRAEREIPTTMNDWCTILDDFLNLAQRPVLEDAGSVTALEAKIKAEKEYEVFRIIQDQNYVSDFDKEIKRLKGE
ncbi:MAG: virulence RhuM family protein [Bacteroidales bacterium]|nr:virulence RhuM family protein [Bacteroidales bacterium]